MNIKKGLIAGIAGIVLSLSAGCVEIQRRPGQSYNNKEQRDYELHHKNDYNKCPTYVLPEYCPHKKH